MRKREVEEEEDSEMEVDNEEGKVDAGELEGGVDDDEGVESADGAEQDDDAENERNPVLDNTFLDSFYGLSAADPKERSRAAQAMLHHCLLGASANSKDAAYAFRRLLNGLCSGRAAARQGNASALASFLKIAFHLGKMDEIRSEATKSPDDGTSSLLNYVRDRLLSATDPQRTDGKKKGSEERDYQFGRLFGIHGVVRSGILLLPSDDDEIRDVASSLVSDLIELFWEKNWMREPAAHGITALLKSFLVSTNEVSQKIGREIVEKIVIPKILIISQKDRSVESDFESLLQTYLPEQVGIGVYVQSLYQSADLPFPLNEPIVSTKTIPWIGQALSETSAIVQPRTHFVWDTLWCYLTEMVENENSSKKKTKGSTSPSKYGIRETIPCGEDTVLSVIESIMQIVVEQKLLRMEEGTSVSKTSHERRSLALCIVRNLAGAPFVSSISGPTQILMDCDAIENIILTPGIIRSLFINVICAGKNKRESSHLLKPLALDILSSLVESAAASGDTDRQFACLKAISNCDPRFDARTKTNAISNLLSSSNDPVDAAQFNLWGKYLTHLESKILDLCCNTEDSSAEANGYVELMYACAKHVVHIPSTGEKNKDAELAKWKETTANRVIGFFISTAFFDCSSVTRPTKTKKGKKGVNVSPSGNLAVESAVKVQKCLQDGQQIGSGIRAILAARFFNLVSDLALTTLRESKDDYSLLAVLKIVCESWVELESRKAKRFESTEKDDEEASPESIINELVGKLNELRKSPDDDNEQSQARCITGITALAMTLQIHRLNCGSDSDEMDDDPDADEEEDEENICSAIEELDAISKDFVKAEEAESNPLLGLAEVCANILSSPLGSGDIGRGAAPKLVREAVRCAWLGGLNLASKIATKEKSLLDKTVVNLLLDGIGASASDDANPDDDDEADANAEDDESDGDSDDDDIVFSKAANALDDDDDMETEEPENSDRDDDESDIELDPSKLHSMLEDDNLDDVDDIVLEHHEGADAALAKLIKLKQEARKAGIEAREKIELANQLRCVFLIELMLTKADSWSNLFQINTIQELVVPLLDRRKRIGKSTQKAIESGGKSGTDLRKQLLQRVTNLIKQKLTKIRLTSMPLTCPIDSDAATSAIRQIMKEAKNSKDKEYQSCCSSSLIFLFRMMPTSDDLISFASTEYGDIVQKWSTKRGSGASLLEDFISHIPALAQASLHGPLIRAAEDARKPILKMEVFRLLSLLFANKSNAEGESEIETQSRAKIHEAQDGLLSMIYKTLQDEEMATPKRARGVFIALEKMLPFLSSPASNQALDSMASIKIEISGLGEKHDGLKVIASKLIEQINVKLETFKAAPPAIPQGEKGTKQSSSTKKSKKKKKKKKLY